MMLPRLVASEIKTLKVASIPSLEMVSRPSSDRLVTHSITQGLR